MTENDSNLQQRKVNIKNAKVSHKTDRETKSKFQKAHEELQDATNSRTHRIWTRTVIIIAVSTLVYFYSRNNQLKELKFALAKDNLPLRMQRFTCSSEYHSEIRQFPQCVPQKCGRFVSDKLVEAQEASILLQLAKTVLSKGGGSSGGASILDIHTGAISLGSKFANVYKMPELAAEFKEEHLRIYNFVKSKIRQGISEQFGISVDSLYLTYPTFFSKITNVSAKTKHDEYWHEHVDKETYPSFHYTSLLYLTTYGKDFQGGRFLFVDGQAETHNRSLAAIEPKLGRVSAFTSGAENRHYVEQVSEGERYAITISFTCNKKEAIADPQLPAINEI